MEMNRNDIALQMECTLYFERNPYALETIAGLSMRLGRTTNDLESVVKHLTDIRILERLGEGERAIYCYKAPEYVAEMDLDAL